MTFKKFRGIKLCYEEQGELYFALKNYRNKSKQFQETVVGLCEEVAGEQALALFELLTRRYMNVRQAAMMYYVSESLLYLRRKEFYEEWYKRGYRMD